jgi:hypothetical protein
MGMFNLLQSVSGAANPIGASVEEMTVSFSILITMPEQLLNRKDSLASPQQMSRKRVAMCIAGGRLTDSSLIVSRPYRLYAPSRAPEDGTPAPHRGSHPGLVLRKHPLHEGMRL